MPSKSFSLLLSEPGRLRSNEEIISHAWPDTFVDQSNLRVQMSAIRRALGTRDREADYIANIPGRGYQFTGQVEGPPLSSFTVQAEAPTGIYGRDEAITAITRLLGSGMVTIVGPGGIGKSTVARGVADHIGARDQMLWVDLAEIESGEYLAATLAAALGLASHDKDVLGVIAATLMERGSLLVLDSCEHVVDYVASLVETLRERAPGLVILATSREPLRVTGERVYRLPPLDVPQPDDELADQRVSPAIRLFLDRAEGQLGVFELGTEDILRAAEICRRLGGIALAIELAAARLDSISLSELAASLEQSFRLLTRGRRNAPPRHRTLRATLDWSYDVLPFAQQEALQFLSVLRGWFSIETALCVLSDAADDLLHELVFKSLVVADARGVTTRYRLLDTTRLYAAELAASGSEHVVMSRLGQHLIAVLEPAEVELYASRSARLERLDELVPQLRVVAAWSMKHDQVLGIRLTVASVPLFFRLSLLNECIALVTWAISYLDVHPDFDQRMRMKLYAALGWPQMLRAVGPRNGATAGAIALAIAEELGDIDYQLRAIWVLWVEALNQAQPAQGLLLAETFATRAAQSSDEVDRVVGLRLVGATLHWLGRHAESQRKLEHMLQAYAALPPDNSAFRFQFDQRITAQVILTRNLWILGQEAAALQMVETTIHHATEMRHELSLANYLAEAACPVALLSGRLDLANEMIALLRHHAKTLSLDGWNSYADCFDAELFLLKGEPARCIDLLRPSSAILANSGFVLFQTYFQSVEARALSALGRHGEAKEVIDVALTACSASGERWCLPELLRVKGMAIVAEAAPGWRSTAVHLLHEAAGAARIDGALAWELRVALDLAGLSDERLGDAAHETTASRRSDGEPDRSMKPLLH